MSNSSEERSPRITRAILVRILAVVAFVCLGTFAVVQSVIGGKGTAGQAALETAGTEQVVPLQQEPDSEKPGGPTESNNTPVKQSTFGDGSNKNGQTNPPKTYSAKNEFAQGADDRLPKKQPPTTSSTSFETTAPPARTAKPLASGLPEINPAASAKQSVVVAKQVSTQPPTLSNSFSTRMPATGSTTMPTTNQSDKNEPLPSLRPPANPSSRFIQGSDNSFGGSSPAATNPLNALDNAAKKSEELAKGLLNATQKSVDNAIQRTQSEFDSVTSSAKSGSSPPPLRPGFDSDPFPRQPTSVVEQQPNLRPPANRDPAIDTARELKPFGLPPTREPSSSFPASTSQVQPAANPLTQLQSTQQRTPPPYTPTDRPSARQPMSQMGVPQPSAALSATNVDSRSSGTPGDRQLEGVQAPSLTIEKIAPREIQVNQPADFQIVVRNSGRVTANDVQVFDVIPTGTEYLSAVPQPTRAGSQDLRWSLGEMRPGQEKRIKIQLKPVQPGEIGSVAHVTFASQASMRTLVTKPVLEIRHSAQPKVLIGDNVVLDVTVENKGDGPANEVVIQEDVPPQLEFSDGFRELEYEIGTLAPGQSKRIRLSLRAAEIGRMKNIMVATAAGGLTTQHAIDLEVIAPQLVANGSGPKRRFLNREATHQFTVENKGTADATNVELIARLPSGLKFVGANNRGKYDPNSHAVYWSLAELTPNVMGTVELQTMPIESGEQKINFEAFADLNQKSEVSQTVIVEHLVDVFFDIDDVVDPIEIGSPTSYRVRIVNQGTKTATNVRIEIEFPNGIQPVSVDGNLPNEIREQQILFAPITSMNPNDEIKLVINGKGVAAGDHRVVVRMLTDGRATPVSKEETTRVYDDR